VPAIVNAIAPQGKFALIDDPETLDIVPLKQKNVPVHWEFMFTRSFYQSPDRSSSTICSIKWPTSSMEMCCTRR
jgi:hypothetical protein